MDIDLLSCGHYVCYVIIYESLDKKLTAYIQDMTDMKTEMNQRTKQPKDEYFVGAQYKCLCPVDVRLICYMYGIHTVPITTGHACNEYRTKQMSTR